MFAQGSQATRPRTLACTDGLLSCRQDFIQFVWGEAEEGQRDSEMKSAWAWRAQRWSCWAPHSATGMNRGRASLSPSRRASLETQGPARQGRWDAAMERAEGRDQDSRPSREGGWRGGRGAAKTLMTEVGAYTYRLVHSRGVWMISVEVAEGGAG